MKPFQSRVVAAWVVALPVAYALVVSAHHKVERLRIDAQGEIANELRLAQHTSFVSLFIAIFAMLLVLTVVIDVLARGIQRFFPEATTSGTSS